MTRSSESRCTASFGDAYECSLDADHEGKHQWRPKPRYPGRTVVVGTPIVRRPDPPGRPPLIIEVSPTLPREWSDREQPKTTPADFHREYQQRPIDKEDPNER